MSEFLSRAELEKKFKERDERKAKLKEAFIKEQRMLAGDYNVEEEVPIDFDRKDVARKLIDRLDTGLSVVVLTIMMVNLLREEANKMGKMVVTKKVDDGAIRVWLV